ncbi:hypothetical protein M8C21_032949 [Ambrosia artemisiifolia]|uniref:1-phosphatidylinositol-4-phosphate 5-kinase n=1 Tax=Ambrosia artemisiifolia TaxID=4212 RepID=A0AAD5BQ52_AMBAR|nr:hypothetical protein M8C21_032949 [Ambrosia artemisiifolia]
MKAWEATIRKTQQAKKQASNIFGSAHVAHVDDEDTEPDEILAAGEVYYAERYLSNGDYYTGHWSDNFPHGFGKYWWTDGCIYVGEWLKGKTMGRGTFSWPTGAVYDGEFKSGYMDGEGTYTGPTGETYRGEWVLNLKHGNGVKEYTNGDVYDGEWCRELQEGNGKYKWTSGSYYIGEWRHGTMCGKGKLVFCDGSMYEGEWDESLPKGNGSFRFADGCAYNGVWNKDPDEQDLTLSQCDDHCNVEHDALQVYDVYLIDNVISPQEKVTILPSQKKLAIWRSSKVSEQPVIRPRRRSVDGRLDGNIDDEFIKMKMLDNSERSIGTRDDAASILSSSSSQGSSLRLPKVVKKQGRPGPTPSLDLKSSAFNPKEKVWTKFPPEGSKYTPPHQSCEFKWKDYCPLVFRRFDLKGSSLGRLTDKPESEIQPTTILKDLDLKFMFRLDKTWIQEFRRQIDRDCDFLEQERIMDYSLLVGLHFKDLSVSELGTSIDNNGVDDSTDHVSDPGGYYYYSCNHGLVKRVGSKLGINMHARVERMERNIDTELIGEPTGLCYDVVMFFGIIDILQDYDITKKLEHAYKSFQYDPTLISAVDPRQYSRRFRDFILNIFIEDA